MLLLFFLLSSIYATINAQPYSISKLNREDIVLVKIDFRKGNTYKFKSLIDKENILYILPENLAKGYYEAYYNGDSNRLALTFYNFGNKSYSQQFYYDGSMKADSEYDRLGLMHGMHVVYNKNGDEIWHSDYSHGVIKSKYTKLYADSFNFTKELIEMDLAWGVYHFTPTAMRERRDKIILRKDGSFYYEITNNISCQKTYSNGNWILDNNSLILTLNKEELWNGKTRKRFIIITKKRAKKPYLIEINEWGANWYGSEYRKCKKC